MVQSICQTCDQRSRIQALGAELGGPVTVGRITTHHVADPIALGPGHMDRQRAE